MMDGFETACLMRELQRSHSPSIMLGAAHEDLARDHDLTVGRPRELFDLKVLRSKMISMVNLFRNL